MIGKTALPGWVNIWLQIHWAIWKKQNKKKQENYLRALKRSLPDSIFNFIIVIFILRMQTLKTPVQ